MLLNKKTLIICYLTIKYSILNALSTSNGKLIIINNIIL